MVRLNSTRSTGVMTNNATRSSDARTLVLGGTGKTGRRVVDRLTALGRSVRVGSRSGEPPFDWEDMSSWPPALHDMRSVYLSYQPDLAAPGAEARVRAFCELAVRSGVRLIVLLSGRGEHEAQQCEQAVRESGADWTILRSSFFAQNFSEGELLGPLLGGELALPIGDVGEPFVDVGDIADVAVAALTQQGHGGHLYEVTGPRLMTFAEATSEIAAVSGQPVGYVRVSVDEFVSALAEQQVPADTASLLTYLFTEVLDGRNAHVSDGVQRALGREPRDFADFVRGAAGSGAWVSRNLVH